MPSLRQALDRCSSTVLGVTYSVWAMTLFAVPSAAMPATRRSLGVSDSTPCSASVRGRAPAA